MKAIYGITKFPNLKSAVVTVGIFDGVHLAHRKIISQVVKKAKFSQSNSVVITFWPHPDKILHKKNILLLSSLQHRIQLIEKLGPDYCLVLNFTPAFSKISIERFVKQILVEILNSKHIYIGDNFKFGRGRRGSVIDLVKIGKKFGFKVSSFRPVKIGNRKVSSSFIRKLIRKLNLKEAKKYLGRDLSLIGRVIHGQKRGKILGFPTANIKPQHEIIPPDGIYAVRLTIDKKVFNGICYVGSAPTFKSDRKVEVHIFNFNKKIYHKTIEIKFISYIRKDKKFKNHQKLVEKIKQDILRAKQVLR